jgi:hypothetical protein
MRDRYRDDSPTAFNLARREIVMRALFLVGGLAAVSTLPAISAPASWTEESSARFMEISSLLIPHRLNEEVGLYRWQATMRQMSSSSDLGWSAV